jgi:site-specific DNA recombinase
VSRRRLVAAPDKPQRVVLYVRVSAVMGRGGDDFHSPEVQTAAMRRITSGMQEVGVIDDDIDQTGRTFSREGIDKIRKLAEARQIDAVAVYNVSRFGRNVLESLQFLNWLAERGVTIISASEHIDTSTPSGRWMLTNMLAIAEMRSDEIGNEWANTIHHRAKAGKPHGKAPVGYVRGGDGKLTVHPATSVAVTRAFRDYADDVPTSRIRQNLRASSGLSMALQTLKAMLRNRVYLGEIRVGDVQVANAHPALVELPVWETVQARIRRDYKMLPKHAEPQYALTGLARCGSCGGAAVHLPDKGVMRLACGLKRRNFEACAGCGGPRVAEVEEEVLRQVRDFIELLRGDVAGESAARSKARRAGVDAVAAKSELKSVRAAMVKLSVAWHKDRDGGRLSEEVYDATMTSLRENEIALVAAVDELREVADVPGRTELAALAEQLLAMWPQMTAQERNRSLRTVADHVLIRRTQTWRQPVSERVHVEFRSLTSG